MLRRSCLAGLFVSYLPLLAVVALAVALFTLAGAFRIALWLLVALVVGYTWMFLVWRGQRLQYRGVRVTREDQPELMAVVDHVMQRAGIRRLDGVWLVPGANAEALHGRRDWLGRRHVGVAIGLLMAIHLSPEELTAVLAHEAGHLTDSNRLRLALGARREYARTKLERRAALPSWWFWLWFLKLTRAQGLDIERHADAVAEQMCGADTAARAQHRVAEASVCHAIAMQCAVRPWWRRRIAPATFFDAYSYVWTRMHDAVLEGVELRMQAPDRPRDTHPGLAQRCGGKHYPLEPGLRGGLTLNQLGEVDRKCAASIRQQECRYPMQTMTWAELREERKKLKPEPTAEQNPAAEPEQSAVTPAQE